MISIRNETPNDYAAVQAITESAFAGSAYGHNGEAQLIETLRREANSTNDANGYLSLVACDGTEVVGHILFTPVSIRTPNREAFGVGLAPMSVLPARQKTGVGSLLVREGLDRLFANGCPFVVVLGHPEYYTRFKFKTAAEYEITHGFEGIPQDVFFVRTSPSQTLKEFSGGQAYYQPAFGPQHQSDR